MDGASTCLLSTLVESRRISLVGWLELLLFGFVFHEFCFVGFCCWPRTCRERELHSSSGDSRLFLFLLPGNLLSSAIAVSAFSCQLFSSRYGLTYMKWHNKITKKFEFTDVAHVLVGSSRATQIPILLQWNSRFWPLDIPIVSILPSFGSFLPGTMILIVSEDQHGQEH
jgi:hypothetical protein